MCVFKINHFSFHLNKWIELQLSLFGNLLAKTKTKCLKVSLLRAKVIVVKDIDALTAEGTGMQEPMNNGMTGNTPGGTYGGMGVAMTRSTSGGIYGVMPNGKQGPMRGGFQGNMSAPMK
uniref:Uncharacterized protein n=1 Tax=Strongyloides venezuelensis TaxID=75913 RepID=A0A0K0G3X8_STRVS